MFPHTVVKSFVNRKVRKVNEEELLRLKRSEIKWSKIRRNELRYALSVPEQKKQLSASLCPSKSNVTLPTLPTQFLIPSRDLKLT